MLIRSHLSKMRTTRYSSKTWAMMEGIGHVQGMTVFVKDAVVGDLAEVKIVKVKKNIAYGRLMKLITPSPYRVEPVCDKAKRSAADAPCSRFPMSSSSNTSGTR